MNKYITRVASLEEALSLAQKWQRSGKYDLFRGQAQNWPVESSTYRIRRDLSEEEIERFEDFIDFFQSNPEIKTHLKKVNETFAIAQHYGLITNYIDFTKDPKVAAYFATNSNSNKVGVEACIICLNSKDFTDFIRFCEPLWEKHLKKNEARPQIVEVHVRNLWRLQAQKGAFLYTPVAGIENVYEFSKILFPFSKPYDGILKEEIYPVRKSRLEILLDLFFVQQQQKFNLKQMLELFGDKSVRNISESSIFDYLAPQCKPHSSWQNNYTKQWKMNIDEVWKGHTSVLAQEIEFSVKDINAFDCESIRNRILKILDLSETDRDRPVNWKILRVRQPFNLKLKTQVEKGCNLIWDGMRTLPYTNIQIASAMAVFIAMAAWNKKISIVENNYLLPGTIEITMKYKNGTHSRACVSGYSVLKFKRKNIESFCAAEFKKDISNNPVAMLQLIRKPNYLFKFQNFVQLFAKEVIPTQMMLQIDNDKPHLLFNPVNLDVFGLA